MKFFENFFKKKKVESSINNNELPKTNSLGHKENLNFEDEKFDALFDIDKNLNYSEKIPIIMETHKLGFEPVVELKNAIERIGKIQTEKRGEFDFKFIYVSNTKIFLNINSTGYDIGEVIEYIFLGGSPALSFGTGPSHFDRKYMFELALKIVGEDDSIIIFRDDLGFQRVEFTRDDIKRYI